jgi:hypothetical protein
MVWACPDHLEGLTGIERVRAPAELDERNLYG